MRRMGVGTIQMVPQPQGGFANTGGLFAFLQASANAVQQLTDTDAVVNFDATGPNAFGLITRTGNQFTVNATGTYLFIFEPQVKQMKNNNVTSFWATKNGVAIPGTGTTYEAAAVGDSNVVSLTLAGQGVPGDIVEFHAKTSLSLGAGLTYSPPAPPVPSVMAVNLVILGFKAF